MLAHRYLGIAVGVVVTAWCLSGVVMMYVPYPYYAHDDRVEGLPALSLSDCCRLPPARQLPNVGFDRFTIEMLADAPVLRLHRDGAAQTVVDLSQGRLLDDVSEAHAHAIAGAFAEAAGIVAGTPALTPLAQDQWTVQASFHPHRPLFKVRGGDPAGSEWYVSSRTGEVVQRTDRRQRAWNWVGAVVHWIYPTQLRQHPAVWTQVVIGLSAIGVFLTLTGLWLGITQLRLRGDRRSPYRGWTYWHHITGLVFGIVTLTWVFSGLMSMNPLGVFDGRGHQAEVQRLRGDSLWLHQVRPLLGELPARSWPAARVRLEGSLFRGELQVVAYGRDGVPERLDGDLARAPLARPTLVDAAAAMRPDVAVSEQGWLERDDAYYYSHHQRRRFPVYRVVYADGERIYLDPETGAVALAVDHGRRRYRWLFNALHSGDFAAPLRRRPIWDFVLLMLLAGTTAGAITGTYLGFRRLRPTTRRPL